MLIDGVLSNNLGSPDKVTGSNLPSLAFPSGSKPTISKALHRLQTAEKLIPSSRAIVPYVGLVEEQKTSAALGTTPNKKAEGLKHSATGELERLPRTKPEEQLVEIMSSEMEAIGKDNQ